MAKWTPMELWDLADSESKGDVTARRARYIELMVEHGYLIQKEPTDG